MQILGQYYFGFRCKHSGILDSGTRQLHTLLNAHCKCSCYLSIYKDVTILLIFFICYTFIPWLIYFIIGWLYLFIPKVTHSYAEFCWQAHSDGGKIHLELTYENLSQFSLHVVNDLTLWRNFLLGTDLYNVTELFLSYKSFFFFLSTYYNSFRCKCHC